MIAGVDGCHGGWIAAIRAGQNTRLEFFETLDHLLRDEALTGAVIDMPIGLPDLSPRPCDLSARQLLRGPRASSVFPAPIRSMLAARDQKEASDLRYAAEGKRCSVQLAAILPKIRQIDQLMTPEMQLRVREGHPEVTFALMNDDHPMLFPKRLQAGRVERIALLRSSFPDLATRLADVGPLSGDAIDAYAMLWTAQRMVAGSARVLTQDGEVDSRGLRMEIVA